MAVLIRAVLGQILTVVANVLVFCLLSCFAMIISPFTTKYSFLAHVSHQPLSDQILMAFTGFSKKRHMIGQEGGKRPILSSLVFISLAFAGLVFTFLSTIVYQVSHTELRNSVTVNPELISPSLMEVRDYYGTNTDVQYPMLKDSFLGPVPLSDSRITRSVLPSKFWNKNIAIRTLSKSQFSGNVYISLSDANWMSIDTGNNVTTSVSMTIDGVTAQDLPVTKPGKVSVQVIENSLPAVFEIPVISEPTSLREDNTYVFVVDGVDTMDYVQFSLLKFDSQKWEKEDNLQQYYEYLDQQKSFVNENGTQLFNYTYDYSTMTTYDKNTLETDMQAGGEDTVKYALISVRNTTSENDLFQTFAITKRSAYRQNSIDTEFGTISLVEYHYLMQITRFSKAHTLKKAYKVKYTGGSYSTNGLAIPVTPNFKSANADYINMATLTGMKSIYQAYLPETYMDMVPTISLLCIYAGLIIGMAIFAIFWNANHFKNRAYSIPLEMLNYLFYNPGNTLHPLLQKLCSIELSMVDGFDPQLGYNHLGLLSVDDSNRITHPEPDVPFGQIFKKPSTSTVEV